ncbi:MAG: hypothetical protein OEW77_06095 [Gemmatimonadota bacterium]|nr:hypothetical protein [Gemmatimonadota bacterium]
MTMRLAVGVAVALALVVACREVPIADARTPYERLVADSSHGDSSAFATLPSTLAGVLDVRALLESTVLDSLPLADCTDLRAQGPSETRRRLQLRLSDSTAIVLFAVADKTSGALERVEFVRRMPGHGQRGLTWDALRDRTTSLWWNEFPRGISRRAERGDLPRGGPVPRAVRALGRQLLTLPCPDSSAGTPR